MKKTFDILLIAILFTILAGFVQYSQVFYLEDRMVMDVVYQQTSSVNQDIKIIKIDEKTLKKYGHFGSWSRDIYAQLVDTLTNQGKPYFIGFDILFTGQIDSKGDQNFADACLRHGNVAVVNNIVFQKKVVSDTKGQTYLDSMYIKTIEEPYDALKKVTQQGFSNAIIDHDGLVRRSMLKIDGQQDEESFSALMAKNYAKAMGKSYQEPHIDKDNIFGFCYSSQSHMYEEVSLVDILDGKVDLKAFEDSFVLVGAHAPAMQDAYQTPIDYSQQMYGVEIHANVAEALLLQKTFLPVPYEIVIAIVMTIIFLTILAIFQLSLFRGFIVCLVITSSYFLICLLVFRLGYEMPLITVPQMCFLAYIIRIMSMYLHELHTRKATLTMFRRYVSPQIVEKIMKEKSLDIRLDGELRDIAVLFVDIRGFTSLSEKLYPEQIVEVLNEYFEMVSMCVFKNNGTLDKYIGDAAMVLFNSPFDLIDYEYLAVKTALDIISYQSELSEKTFKKYGIEIGFGIGVHCGKAVTGNIGSSKRLDFTAIGDCVNTASRIEGKAKAGQVLVSQEIVNRLKNKIETIPLGEVTLKGKKQNIAIYEVINKNGRGL